MKWKVLVSAPYMQPALDHFRPMFEEHGIELCVPTVNERLEEDELLNWVGDIDGAICGDDRFTERVLKAAPRLKVISKWGTGVDSIDRAACKRLGIAVRNTPDAFSQAVADTVMGYILCFARGLPWLDERMKVGEWQKKSGRALHECTIGVIGVGHVGKAVVRRAQAFGMKLLGNDIVMIPAQFAKETGIRMVSLAELLFRADFVSVNCDLNRTSYHLIGDSEFDLLKPGAVLINTARGPIVDESAMVRALQTGRLAGAALDVFEHEPLPLDSPLRQMSNVMLAPHNANSSHEAWNRVHVNTCANLLEELCGRSS
jgi:D-3-phosphoglycerate dehydrogenase